MPAWLALRKAVSDNLQIQNTIESMTRVEVINKIIEVKGYSSYLEIGVDNPENCFNKIVCENKTGVDPYLHEALPHEWTEQTKYEYISNVEGKLIAKESDEFFEKLPKRTKYDFVFIDGLHLKEQVLRDVANAEKHLKKGGFIMLHDCLPKKEEMQTTNPAPFATWTGTVWEAFATLRTTREDLQLLTINTDFGLGCVIPDGKNELWVDKQFPKIDWSWEYFTVHKNELMKVTEVAKFLEMLENSAKD